MMPPVPIIGSAMKAAMVSAPSRAISFSNSSAQYAANCVSLMPAGAPGDQGGGRGWAVPVRADRVLDAIDRQVEVLVEARQAGQAAGHDAGAVVAAVPRD